MFSTVTGPRCRDCFGRKKDNAAPRIYNVVDVAGTTNAYGLMLREIRSQGLWLLGLGAIHVVTAGLLSAPWGLLLLVVGLASFYVREPAMFVVYGVTLAWAATSNMLSGEGQWVGFGLLQLFLAYRIFRQFFHFRRVQAEYAGLAADMALREPPAPERALHVFPWLSAALGPLALAGLVGSPVWLADIIINLGVLALALGLASLLCGYRYKPLAVVGVAASALQLVMWLAQVLL